MPKSEHIPVSKLSLDLRNPRTVPQRSEVQSVHSMAAISPERFWGLTESLLSDHYHETQNILILRNGADLVVKEGNRRVAALKLILRLIPLKGLDVPSHIEEQIANLSVEDRRTYEMVPCAVYEAAEVAIVDRLVTLTHGYEDKASREGWGAVAKARHSRDQLGNSEPPLDLLESYLKNGTNLSADQKERWAGVYHLTVLEEAMKRLAPRLGAGNSRELADLYPKRLKERAIVDDVLLAIGLNQLDFKKLRSGGDIFESQFGFPPMPSSPEAPANNEQSGKIFPPSGIASNSGTKGGPLALAAATRTNAGKIAVSLTEPRSVRRKLSKFVIRGNNREKVVTLRDEIKSLKHEEHPFAFCFLLRSMFEISAKAYCDDYNISRVERNGNDRPLADLLRAISQDLVSKNPQMKRELTGAMADLGNANGLLSVTSLNQLVHNKTFSVSPPHISSLFHNVFPLMEAMNR